MNYWKELFQRDETILFEMHQLQYPSKKVFSPYEPTTKGGSCPHLNAFFLNQLEFYSFVVIGKQAEEEEEEEAVRLFCILNDLVLEYHTVAGDIENNELFETKWTIRLPHCIEMMRESRKKITSQRLSQGIDWAIAQLLNTPYAPKRYQKENDMDRFRKTYQKTPDF